MASKLETLSAALITLNMKISAHDIMKLADSRSSIVNVLGFSQEEADFFNSIDTQKAFNIARWYKEWLDAGPSYHNHDRYRLKDLYLEFEDAFVVSGDRDYMYDPQTFRFIDYILEDNSLYQKVKKKPIKEALEDFYNVILRKEYPGKPVLKIDKDLTWYDVGQECEITSGFLHNCGSLGDFGPEGEHGSGSDTEMTMMVLKNKNKKPLAVMTVGRSQDKNRNPHAVIINAAENLNRWPTNPIILDAMWKFARENNYEFANIYDRKSGKLIEQTPGLNNAVITSAGFNIIKCYAETISYTSDSDEVLRDE